MGEPVLAQADDGHWPGDYGGPMFLMPGMIISLYTTGKLESVLSAGHRHEMVRYLVNHQNSDGGYGLHIEGSSTMFGTVLRWCPRCPLEQPRTWPTHLRTPQMRGDPESGEQCASHMKCVHMMCCSVVMFCCSPQLCVAAAAGYGCR